MRKLLLFLMLALSLGIPRVQADTATISLKNSSAWSGYTSTTASKTDQGFTLKLDKGTGSTDITTSTFNTSHLKLYGGSTLTVSGNNNETITGIVITATSSSYAKSLDASSGSGSWSNETYTWTGSTTSVTF